MCKKYALIVLSALILSSVCACQKAPESGIVTSKNDGAFEAALEVTPDPAAAPEDTEPMTYIDSFTGMEEEIRFEIDLDEPAVTTALPVIQVRPQELTPEMAERAARAIFGEADIYEYTSEFSKAEIEQAIMKLKQEMFDWETRVANEGADQDDQDLIREEYSRRIAGLESSYESAPESVQQTLCTWEYHEENYYKSSAGAGEYQDAGHRYIKALAELNGKTWVYQAMSRMQDDYRVQSLSLYEDDRGVSDDDISAAEWEAMKAEHAAYLEIADLEAEQTQALALAESLGSRRWVAVPRYVLEANSDWATTDESVVVLTPVYNGVPVTWHFGGFNPRSEDIYASTYGYEEMTVLFDADGISGFNYSNMLEVVATVNDNVEILPFEKILTAAENQMKMTNGTDLNMSYGEWVSALEISVTNAELGLSRVRIKDSAADFYLIPTYTFYGIVTALDENGEPIMISDYDENGHEIGESFPYTTAKELAVINAVDGSAINTLLGY